MIWEYYLKEVNNNNKQTVTLMFNNHCIHVDASDFQNYQELNKSYRSITNYFLSLFKEGQQRYNRYLYILKQAENDLKYTEKKKKKKKKKQRRMQRKHPATMFLI